MTPLLRLAALLATLASPGGGQPYEALDAGDVFVATITRVDDKDATNSKPPRVWLEVSEILRGDPKVVRSPAIWSPPFHGIDWGDENVPELKQWKVAPLKGPKVGEKFILGGRLWKPLPGEKAAPEYHLLGFVRIPFSEAARKQAIEHLAVLDAYHKKYAEELAATTKERDRRAQKWREAMTAEVIDRRTQEADGVAIATIKGGDGYEVETMLKGLPRMSTGGTYYVAIPSEGYDKRILDIISDRPRVILFLSEKKLLASVTNMHTQLVDPYEGIVLADAAAIAAVKESLAKKPAPKPKPVLVISSFPYGASAPLAAAARSDFAVVESQQFSAHGEHTVAHIRKTIPHADILVTIGSGPQRAILAVRITADGSVPLYESTWPEKIGAEQVGELLKKLRPSP